jgi:hypothetical protein
MFPMGNKLEEQLPLKGVLLRDWDLSATCGANFQLIQPL